MLLIEIILKEERERKREREREKIKCFFWTVCFRFLSITVIFIYLFCNECLVKKNENREYLYIFSLFTIICKGKNKNREYLYIFSLFTIICKGLYLNVLFKNEREKEREMIILMN
jgi:hypothetical protein